MRISQQRTLIFDWNSTLLDDISALVDSFNILYAEFGRSPIEVDVYRERYELPIERFYLNHGFDLVDIPLLMSKFSKIFHDNYEPMAFRCPLRDGARSLLEFAHDHEIHTVILSNHLLPPILEHLDRFEIGPYIQKVIAYPSRGEQFKSGSKGEMLRHYMSEHAYDPRLSVIVGDTIEEVHIATEQGLTSVAITGGCASEKRLREANPHHLIHSLSELRPILTERWGL